MRDDFSNQTKELLAKRVGFRYSNPSCRQHTSGPQSKNKKKSYTNTVIILVEDLLEAVDKNLKEPTLPHSMSP